MAREWTVGELAKQAGVSVRTLHHYDEIGLVSPTRSLVGHRRYSEPDVARLTQVVALRSLGLALGEVRRCLDNGEALSATLTRQLRDLDQRVAQTTELRDRLALIVAKLEEGREFDTYDLMTLIGDTKMLAEGKTKLVVAASNGEVLIRSKDDIKAGDGAKRDLLDGKAAASTRTTSNIFQLLERNGVRTHFVDRVDDVTFRARNVEMIPLELVARRYATGSVRDRFTDLSDGTVFEELMFEIFEKDDANHDPLLDFDFDAGVLRRHVPNKTAASAIGPDAKAGDLISEEPLEDSRRGRGAGTHRQLAGPYALGVRGDRGGVEATRRRLHRLQNRMRIRSRDPRTSRGGRHR
ncbi:MAG TPA: phosphoribosylaminoimidazolesuccinocarboxamide synthase [Acidimicrobiales bacterium]|nr:phosphoribosylaminoimidazolesuccinocarboxamide synthase [Acidimicrobiales bacterium]